jgi:hypothetical protein
MLGLVLGLGLVLRRDKKGSSSSLVNLGGQNL